jgi:hypothetical protein
MFGMENAAKPKTKNHQYLLEQDLEQPSKRKEILTLVDERLVQLKNSIRSGSDKQSFDNLNIILQGYVSLKRVLSKITKN